ncbi:MAG: hypothetical protein OSB70_11130 [Myxococcota bacterium]|nr:hypothetical protein [Myxococcota bacterium]
MPGSLARGFPGRSAASLAPRRRLLGLAGAAALWAGFVLLFPDSERRAPWLYAGVLTLGYGHLLGGALLGRPPLARAAGDRWPWARRLALPRRFQPHAARAAAIAGLALLYCGYASALPRWPGLAALLLALATAHTVENDLALSGLELGRGRLPPMALDTDTWATVLGITALVLVLAGAALASAPVGAGGDAFAGIVPGTKIDPGLLALRALAAGMGGFLLRAPGQGAREGTGLALIAASAVDPIGLCTQTGITFEDVFALSTLYHLTSWWVLALEKSRRPSAPPAFRAELLAIHALPALLLGATFLLPESAGGAWRAAFFSPAPYLFWSLAHAVQTAAGRRRASATPADSIRARGTDHS